mgnify:CR=1 FL=1
MNSIAIYGAGYFGRAFLKAAQQQGEQVVFLLDEQKINSNDDIPVFFPEEADKNIKVIISLPPLRRTDRAAIKDKLMSFGYSNIVDFLDAMKLYPRVFEFYAQFEHLWMRNNKDKTIDDNSIGRLSNRLCDKESKELLNRIVKFRQTLSPEYYIYPDSQNEYFCSNVPIYRQNKTLRFVDCGAFNGDTMEDLMLLQRNGILDVEYCVSFEPDNQNLSQLNKAITKFIDRDIRARLLVYPCGVWSENTVLNFSEGQTSSSTFSGGNGGTSVPVVSIDNCLYGMAPSFIKMDIEGAEQQALSGAKSTIRKYKPTLAICVYHKPADLWEIPELIDDIWPGYDMYLRVHEHMGLSTVLYCVPRL